MSQSTAKPTHQIKAFDPCTGQYIVLQIPEKRLREIIADNVRNSIIASWAIEGEDISDIPLIDPQLVPASMLTTQRSDF